MPLPGAPQQRESFREICVKVHVRKPGRDAWTYLGRAFVTQEVIQQTSRVGEYSARMLHLPAKRAYRAPTMLPVVRAAASGKVMTTFSEVRAMCALPLFCAQSYVL